MKKFIEYIKTCKVNGGFLASPLYKPYKRVWLRDHAFITYSLLLSGENVKEEIFWMERILKKEATKVEKLLEMNNTDSSDFLNQDNHPRARYTPYFEEIHEPWSERQYDGVAMVYGTLLFYENKLNTNILQESLKQLYDLYFEKVYLTPCADLWEMHDTFIHAQTLGAIYWALSERVKQLKKEPKKYEKIESLRNGVKKEIYTFIKNDVVRKMKSDKNTTPIGLDSSVLLLFTLFNVFEEKDLLESTLGKLYYHLSPDGLGLRRFLIDNELDEYFGGGVWYITTYWAAEAYLKLGKKDKAKKLLEYRFRFPLPEQIVDTPLIFTEEGKQKWLRISKSENDGIPGPAEPLTWSNSEFLRVSLNVPL